MAAAALGVPAGIRVPTAAAGASWLQLQQQAQGASPGALHGLNAWGQQSRPETSAWRQYAVAACGVGACAATHAHSRRRRPRQHGRQGVTSITRVTGTAQEVATKKVVTQIPPVLVVNLDRSQDRWQSCQEEFTHQSLAVERFPATDGKAMTQKELDEVCTTSAKYFCTPGMIGCFMSHHRIWEKVVSEQLPATVVFEDDVRLYPDFEPRVKELLQELPDDWDVCLLGAVACVNYPTEPLYMKYYSFLTGGGRASPGKTRGISEHIFVPHRPAGTHAYMVSQKGAQKLLELLPKAKYHVDLSAWALQDLRLYAAKEFLATQAFEETSTVSKDTSRSKRILAWLWTISGFAHMASKGGVEHMAWAWKAAIFAIPTPWGRKVAIGMGPSSSIFLMMLLAAAFMRSPQVLGLAIAYEGLVCSMIRYLAGTWSFSFTLGHALAAAALIYLPA